MKKLCGVVGEVARMVRKVQIVMWHLHRFIRHLVRWVIPVGGAPYLVYVGF